MPLRIPLGDRGHAHVLTEHLCEVCDNELYVPVGSGEKGYCYYCGNPTSYANGDFDCYAKQQHEKD